MEHKTIAERLYRVSFKNNYINYERLEFLCLKFCMKKYFEQSNAHVEYLFSDDSQIIINNNFGVILN